MAPQDRRVGKGAGLDCTPKDEARGRCESGIRHRSGEDLQGPPTDLEDDLSSRMESVTPILITIVDLVWLFLDLVPGMHESSKG